MKTYLFENRVISSDESYDGKDPIVVDGKVISVKTATHEQLGVVQPDGETIKINNGIISAEGSKPYELPIADADTLGGVKVGSGLSITGDGVLSATGIEVEIVDNLTNTSPDKALSANMGKTLNDTKQDKLTAGTGISIEDNTISATVSGSDYTGTAPINVDNEQHTISVNTATTDTLGVVQPDGTTITIDNGVISAVAGTSYELPIADSDTLGGVKVGSGLSITGDGVLSANNQGGFSVAVEDITINKEFTPMEGVYANGKYVIVGGSINTPETTNRGIYSTDGITWTEMTLPSSQNWMSVTYGDGKFAAIAAESNLSAYSMDGISWNSSNLPSSRSWTSVTYGDGKFVAVAQGSDKGAYSTDGISWTEMTLPSSQNWMSVTYGDGKFVAVAESSDKGAYSTDGISWTEMSLPSTSLIQVIWCKDKFIAVPNNENCILYSLNGTEWTKINVPLIPSRIAFYDGFYVTVPYIEEPSSLHGEIFVSKNGLSWEKTSLSRQGLVLCLVGGEPGFVGMFILGNNGFLVHINSISNVVDNLTDTSTDKALSANMGKTLNDTKQDKLTAGTGISIEDNTISAGYYALSQSPIASSIISEEQFGVLSFASIAYGNGRFVATPMGGTTVAYSTDQGETWTQVPEAVPFISNDDEGYTHVIYGGGKFLLLAYGDTGVYSEDGITWTPTTLPDVGIWYSAAYGQDRFVAIAAESNLSAYSMDGISWNSSNLPSSRSWTSVTYGDGKFVAVAQGSDKGAYSTDGITWTEMSFPNSREWISVCYGNGKFVSISQSENIIAYSTDGITWTEVAIPASSVYWFMIKFGGGVFVAVGLQGNDIIYSADGVNWSLQALPEDQSAMQMFVDLSFGENKYIALAVTGSIAIFPLALKSFQEINTELNTLASTVGENRQFIESQAVEIKDIRETITIENLQEWDITYCGKSNIWHSVAYGENKIIVAGYTTKVVLYSDDNGINWNIAELPYEADWTDIVYGANKFVVLGQHNTTALYSADGIHWTPTNPLSEEDENNWTCLNYVGDKFLAYNSINNRIAYSTDGISWNSATITENISFKKIAYGNGIYVSMDSYKDYVLTSSDGIEWVKKQIPMSASWCDIAYGGDGKFVMISFGRDIIYSVDGSNWQKADTQLDMERITSGTSDSGTDIFVAVGNNKAWKSADGITWDEFSIESLAGPQDITYINSGTYVTVDDDNIIVLSVSDELINGASQDVPKINEWSSITYGDGKFVIVANNGYYCATTTDPSANWNYYNMPRLQNWTSVTYGDGKFVAVAQGSDKGAYSTDGITWTEMTLPSDDKWKAITFGWDYEDPVFIAVADDSSDSATYSVARSNDGIEWEGDTLPFKSNWSNIAHAYFEETKENVFVAISSSSSKTVYSPDGGYYWNDTYNQLPSDATFRALAGGGGGKIWAIQYGGNKAVYMSNNRSWTTITMPSSQNWTSIVYGNGKYIALASDSNTLAINPESSEEWKEITASKAPTDTSMPGIYGNGKFVFINSSISTATSKTKKLGDVLTQIWISTLS